MVMRLFIIAASISVMCSLIGINIVVARIANHLKILVEQEECDCDDCKD